MLRDERIEQYLRRLASGHPTPGGGATGALAIAQGAGLVAMAARYSGDEGSARRCEDAIRRCLEIADDDERAFGAVAEAFGLPQETDQEKARRSEAVQAALQDAVEPPRALVGAAATVLQAAGDVLADANENVLSDVGTALGCVRAGLAAAVVTLLTNLGPLHDEGLAAALRAEIMRADRLTGHADELAGQVRGRIVR